MFSKYAALKNLQTALEVEAVIRDNGAIPATTAILDGLPHIGQFSPLRPLYLFLDSSTPYELALSCIILIYYYPGLRNKIPIYILSKFLTQSPPTILLQLVLHLSLTLFAYMIIGLSGEQLKKLAITGRQFQKTARSDIEHVDV